MASAYAVRYSEALLSVQDDGSVRVLPNTPFQVFVAGTTSEATLYSGRSKVPFTGALLTDSLGNGTFWVDPGYYDIQLTGQPVVPIGYIGEDKEDTISPDQVGVAGGVASFASAGYSPPPAGIPAVDLSVEVQTALSKANSALQTITPASALTTGGVRLTNELGGTYDAPTVPGLASKVDTGDARLTNARTPVAGSVTNASVAADAAIAVSKLNIPADGGTSTPSLRTLGTGAAQAVAGTDGRLSDARAPLDGSVTNASVAVGAAIATSKINGLDSALTAKYEKPGSGIPSSDLAAAVVTSLGKADSAVQSGAAVTGVSIDGGATYQHGDVIISDSGGPGVGDATLSAKGLIQLAGDLDGTAAAPTVPGLTAKANDNAVVKLAGTQTVTGNKDFTGSLAHNGNAVVDTTDARLSDARTPSAASVTTTQVHASAGILKTQLAPLAIVDGDVSVLSQSKITNLVTDLAAKTPSTRTITAGTGLTGGGDLSANRTLAVSYGTTAGTAAQGDDTRLINTRTPSADSIDNTMVKANADIAESKLVLASDAAPGVASRRTLGTGANQALPGNHASTTNARTPTAGSVTDASVAPGANIAQSKVQSLTTDLAAKYTRPSTGIPKDDLDSAVQTSLGQAILAKTPGVAYGPPSYNPATKIVSVPVTFTQWGYDPAGVTAVVGDKVVTFPKYVYDVNGAISPAEMATFEPTTMSISSVSGAP